MEKLYASLRCPFGKRQILEAERKVKFGVTVWWLVCPRLKKAASYLEAASFLKKIEGDLKGNGLWYEVQYEDFLYARQRHLLFAGRLPAYGDNWLYGGVGGRTGGVKCLHAELAFFLATGNSVIISLETVADSISEAFEKFKNVCQRCEIH